MKAVGFNQPRAIEDVHALEDIQLEQPKPGPRDLLVAVEAVSVNPVETKVRQRPLAEKGCPLYPSPSPRNRTRSRMPSPA